MYARINPNMNSGSSIAFQKKKCLVQSTSMCSAAEDSTVEDRLKTTPYATPAIVARIM